MDSLFEIRQLGDYHNEMNRGVLKNWFKKIVKFLPENSEFIMDNTPYYSVKLECFTVSYCVKIITDAFNKYIIDSMAEKNGCTILTLPPHHCMFNVSTDSYCNMFQYEM